MHVFLEYESEVRNYCRQFPVLFDRACDSKVYDSQGREYIDFLCGAGSLNYGHNNVILKQSVVEYLQKDGIVISLDFHTVSKQKFMENFCDLVLSPRNLDYKLQFTGPTGTNVVESAVKLSRKITGRQNVVAFTNAFHGMSGVSLSLTGNKHHRQQYMMGHVTRLPFCGYLGPHVDTVAYFEKLLLDNSSGIDTPAAVVVETVQAEGGVNVASVDWLVALRELTTRHGIILIVDDIQVGCGRTGRFFSFERAGIVPDMVCLSKALSGLGLPFSLLLIRRDMDAWSAGEDSGTFRGNNLAFISASTALETYWADRKLETDVAEREKEIVEWLYKIKNEYQSEVKDARGLGLIHGIEFYRPHFAQLVSQQCFQDGLIAETCGSEDQVLKILPSLTVTNQVLLEGLDRIEAAIAKSKQ